MNIQVDPVGYKALSRFFAAAKRTDAEISDEVRSQGYYIRIGTYATVTLAAVALLWVLHESRAIAMPVALGVVVALIFGPLGDRLSKYRIPAPLTVLVVVAGGISAFATVVYLVSPGLGDLSQAAPRLARSFDRIVKSVETIFEFMNSFKRGMGASGALITETRASNVDIAAKVASFITPAFSQFVIFFFTLLLFAASRQDLRNTLVMSFNDRDQRLAALKSFTKAERRLMEYIVAVTAINAMLGAVVACTFWLAGIPGALIWGVLAFIVNFLPVVGPLLLKAILLVFGLAIDPTFPTALIPVGIFLAISLVEANVITPRIVGDRMTMSPLMVFLSVVFWTWLWGFAGAFLAMPLLAILSVIRDEMTDDGTDRKARNRALRDDARRRREKSGTAVGTMSPGAR